MKKILAFGMGLVLMGSLAACQNTSSTTTTAAETTTGVETTAGATAETTAGASVAAGGISTEGLVDKTKLVMATNAEFPPYEYREGDQFVGIDVEIAGMIAQKMGVELVIEDMAFDAIINAVDAGKADIGMAGMTVTEERLKNIDFSTTYAEASQVVVVQTGSKIKTPDDLTGKVIGVQLGTTGDIYCSDVEGAKLERYAKGFEAIQALSQGKVDAVVIDGEPAKVFVSQAQGIEILPDAFTVEEYAISMKKGNTALVDSVNQALKELEAEGKLQEVVDKYIKAE